MKRSQQVTAPLLASAALTLLAGCRQEQMQRCVDEHNVVVDDSLCKVQPNADNNYYHTPYRFYYGGGGSYFPGSVATGGGYAPVSGFSYATSRGGFGSTHAGGEGGGE